jgi:hypothetical protein
LSDATPVFEITRLTKAGGPLTKRISLADDGSVKSDGSACVMSEGQARRVTFDNLESFGACIADLASDEAIALGALRADLPDSVEIVTKDRLEALKSGRTASARLTPNGVMRADLIARTSEHIVYRPGHPALALIDVDTKAMPVAVKNKVDAIGGFWPALVTVLPELVTAGRVMRRSTSAGISRADTGTELPGSNGLHFFIIVKDGVDVERFLRTLHDRAWLHGFGWMMVGAGGQLLERSIVDRMVYAPERLVFEGPPHLEPPLVQDKASRAPVVRDGAALDTVAACLPLTIIEQSRLRELRSREAHRLAPDAAKERDAFIARQSKRLAERTGTSVESAARVIGRQCGGVLLPCVALPFDDPKLAGITVADVLADPARFEGATLADPLEGVGYGRCCAMIMRRADGTPWIHSFAHGRTIYELRFDARAITEAIAKAPDDQLVSLYVKLMLAAEVSQDEAEALRNRVAERSGTGKRTLENLLKQTRREQASQRAQEERTRRAAERLDPRPEIPAPATDAPWLPQMSVLNDVLGASTAPEPPMRDIDGVITQVRVRRVPNMHMLTSEGANDGDAEEARQAATEQPLLTRLDETRAAELIEQHIDYVDENGRHVHLAAPFVKHFLTRADDALPIVAAIATLPIVLSDGTLLAKRGLDRQRGIVFRVPPDLLAMVPRPEECTDAAVAAAMRFLVDDWLCDVATDYTGKCILIAAALTVIERSVLPERPAFFVTAGRRGGGKTTALIMLLVAVTGIRPSAAAWSPNEEERRKAVLSYLMEALPAIIWDNIPRGTQISCPHIEKSCTTAFYSDRRLGVSEMVAVSASVVHLFTGNNIGRRGDLASRSLQVRLEIDRADPENREFTHPDPVGWTENSRGEILRALYTLLLGNPTSRPGSNVAPQTRFKAWWRLVGSAVEHAATLHAEDTAERVAHLVDDPPGCSPVKINFRDLFLSQEEDDEESASLTDALAALAATVWGRKDESFQAVDLARKLNDVSDYRSPEERERAAVLRDFFFPKTPQNQDVSPKAVAKALKRHIGEPVKKDRETLILKAGEDSNTKTAIYYVQVTK